MKSAHLPCALIEIGDIRFNRRLRKQSELSQSFRLPKMLVRTTTGDDLGYREWKTRPLALATSLASCTSASSVSVKASHCHVIATVPQPLPSNALARPPISEYIFGARYTVNKPLRPCSCCVFLAMVSGLRRSPEIVTCSAAESLCTAASRAYSSSVLARGT